MRLAMPLIRRGRIGPRGEVLAVLLAVAGLVGCNATPSGANSPPSREVAENPEVPAWVPQPQGWVTDYAEVLLDAEAAGIASMLAAFERETSCEFAILTVADLRGETIDRFSLRVARSWGLGKGDASNGLLIVVAVEDRKARIEVGDGLVEFIPDGLAREVMKREMVPAFRGGRYADGIEGGLQSLLHAVRHRNPTAE